MLNWGWGSEEEEDRRRPQKWDRLKKLKRALKSIHENNYHFFLLSAFYALNTVLSHLISL